MAKGTKPKKPASPPPFETASLREELRAYMQLKYPHDGDGNHHIGWYKWGVYIFYDYDGEPIYVGQTNEKVSGRISRHLTNQRTDAVAMSVLDPFEVYEIEVYPLPEFQLVNNKPDFKMAKMKLDALEFLVHQKAIEDSKFKAILNEKDPDAPKISINPPAPLRGCIVSDKVKALRSHLDVRVARRAQTIAKLAQVISERDIQKNGGLRRVLLVQSQRLASLAEQRYYSLGGEALVERGPEENAPEDDSDVEDDFETEGDGEAL
jgi:hypothetical protein